MPDIIETVLALIGKDREPSLTKHRDHAGVFVPPPLLYMVPMVAAALLHARHPWPLSGQYAMALAIGGALTIAAGIGVGLTSVYSFGRARTTILPAGRPTTAIVDSGPYRLTRNPMYVAMSLAYLGLAVLLNNMWALVLLPGVLVVVDRAVIRREERYLAAKFGEPYRAYCARVRRWL